MIAADPAVRHRLGAAGRRRVVEHFGIEQHIERWLAFYREVTGVPPTGTPLVAGPTP